MLPLPVCFLQGCGGTDANFSFITEFAARPVYINGYFPRPDHRSRSNGEV